MDQTSSEKKQYVKLTEDFMEEAMNKKPFARVEKLKLDFPSRYEYAVFVLGKCFISSAKKDAAEAMSNQLNTAHRQEIEKATEKLNKEILFLRESIDDLSKYKKAYEKIINLTRKEIESKLTEAEKQVAEDRKNEYLEMQREANSIVKEIEKVWDRAIEICQDRAKEWTHENVETAITNYAKKSTWDKSKEAEACSEAIRREKEKG